MIRNLFVSLFVICAFSSNAAEQLMNLTEKPGKKGRFKVPTELVWPANAGEADICLWHDDKFAAFSITIDDNCQPDHAFWMKLSDELGIKLTWFVITDKVEKDGFSGKWSDWQKLADAGHSIQSHTTNHTSEKFQRTKDKSFTLSEEKLVHMYKDSIDLINEKVKNNLCCCIAYPRGEPHIDIAKRYAIACRGVAGTPNWANAINYMNTNKGSGEPAFIDVVLTGKTDQEKAPKWLRNRPDFLRGWNIALYHYVQSNKANSPVTADAERDVRYAAAKKDVLWIGRFEDVARYGQERDTATLKVTVNTADKIAFDLTDRMDDKLFTFPLTVKVRLPDGWKSVKATQGGNPVNAKFIDHAGAPYALVSSIPDRGETVLTK